MLERLILKNFQRHRKLKLELDPRVTTLVGPTDVGKSSVLRALRWLCTNKPSGAGFVRHGEASTTVTLDVDGRRVKRGKGKANFYQLDDARLVSFKTDVPDPVAKLLNVSEVNFVSQIEPPFWFALTPGEVSRQLNQIINLGVIDSTLGHLHAKLRENSTRMDVCRERRAEARAQVAALADAPAADAALRAVEGLCTTAQRLRDRADLAGDLLRQGSEHAAGRDRAAGVLKTGLSAVAAGERWRAAEDRRDRLVRLVTEAQAQGSVLQHSKIPDPAPVEKLWERVTQLAGRAEGLGGLIYEARTWSVAASEAGGNAEHLQREFDRAMGPVCPLCGSRREQDR